MPLRDHFHAPHDEQTSWDTIHGMWPAMMVMQLNRHLPQQYVAGPFIPVGSEIEVDVATFEQDLAEQPDPNNGMSWQLATPNVAVETELLEADHYEVRVYHGRRQRRLVAVIEIVSPSNKDRPESRQSFTAKCEALLRHGVSVAIVDIVTSKQFCLYTELLELIGQSDPTLVPQTPAISASACRWIPRGGKHILETWSHVLHTGQPLPTLPIWLAENFAVPLDLESSYEQTRLALRLN